MPRSLFATDLHGHLDRYEKLFAAILSDRPDGVFLGGDLLPGGAIARPGAEIGQDGFIFGYLEPSFQRIRRVLGADYPQVFLIPGNDDPKAAEPAFQSAAERGVWAYIPGKAVRFAGFDVYGYAYVPPTPFLLKDWERYDVSRYVDPGCLSPEEGWRTVPISPDEARWGTIQKDLAVLAGDAMADRAIFLFHVPPYGTALDRAALDGRWVDHVPLDLHIGSIAVHRLIQEKQPRITLHGHVHESTRLTGAWRAQIGSSICVNGAHDGPELSLVRFDPETPATLHRDLL